MTSRVFPKVRKADQRLQLDRATWAATTQVVLAYDLVGTGEIITELLEFKAVFEEAPFFAYGIELQPGETLEDGDYPFVTCGVSSWETTLAEEELNVRTPFYLGAYIYINVVASKQYRTRLRLSFEGIAVRNVEYFRGLNG
jgi:hypothetical protein